MLNTAIAVTQFKSTHTTYNEAIILNLANGTFPELGRLNLAGDALRDELDPRLRGR